MTLNQIEVIQHTVKEAVLNTEKALIIILILILKHIKLNAQFTKFMKFMDAKSPIGKFKIK